MQQRHHALDTLRAVVMILGIVLHAGMAYITLPMKWFVNDPGKSAFFDMLGLYIHAFRMPVFFMLAGFFAGLVYERYGRRTFVQNRFRRIALPFACAVVLTIPLLQVMYIFGDHTLGKAEPGIPLTQAIAGHFLSGRVFEGNRIMHLWFLYYALLFYVLHVMISYLPSLKGTKAGRMLESFTSWTVRSGARALIWSVPTVASLYLMIGWIVDTPAFYTPHIKFIFFYGTFYAFGWLLYRHMDVVQSLEKRAWLHLLSGTFVFLPAYLVLFLSYGLRPEYQGAQLMKFAVLFCLAYSTWLLVLGFTGVFVKYFNRESRVARYLSDSSYWLYLAHLPLVAALQIALVNAPLSIYLKFSLVCVISFTVLIFVYDRLVKNTFIGTFLNGKRKKSVTVQKVVAESPNAEEKVVL